MFLVNVRIVSYTFCNFGPKLCLSIRTSQVSNVIISLLYDQFTLFPCVKAHFLRVLGRHGRDDSLLKLFFFHSSSAERHIFHSSLFTCRIMCFALMTHIWREICSFRCADVSSITANTRRASVSLRLWTSSPIKNTFGGCRLCLTLQTFHHSALTAPSRWHKNLKVHFSLTFNRMWAAFQHPPGALRCFPRV